VPLVGSLPLNALLFLISAVKDLQKASRWLGSERDMDMELMIAQEQAYAAVRMVQSLLKNMVDSDSAAAVHLGISERCI